MTSLHAPYPPAPSSLLASKDPKAEPLSRESLLPILKIFFHVNPSQVIPFLPEPYQGKIFTLAGKALRLRNFIYKARVRVGEDQCNTTFDRERRILGKAFPAET